MVSKASLPQVNMAFMRSVSLGCTYIVGDGLFDLKFLGEVGSGEQSKPTLGTKSGEQSKPYQGGEAQRASPASSCNI